MLTVFKLDLFFKHTLMNNKPNELSFCTMHAFPYQKITINSKMGLFLNNCSHHGHFQLMHDTLRPITKLLKERPHSIVTYYFDGTIMLINIQPIALIDIYRPLGYERVYLPLYKVADTPFNIQGGDI